MAGLINVKRLEELLKADKYEGVNEDVSKEISVKQDTYDGKQVGPEGNYQSRAEILIKAEPSKQSLSVHKPDSTEEKKAAEEAT